MKKIKLSKGKFALVDDEDFEWLNGFKWIANKLYSNGNKFRAARGRTKGNQFTKMHRMILDLTDPKIKVDHKDRNPLNNQRANLRICDDRQNACNVTSVKNSTSKYLGVSLAKTIIRRKTKSGLKIYRYQAWRASIFLNRKQIHLGRFKKEKDAAIAYNIAAVLYHGEFANLNKVS